MRRLKARRKHAVRADFPISRELKAAFDAYLASEPHQPASAWPEFIRLADMLEEAGAPVQPLLAGCVCWHPRAGGMTMPGELAVYRRLVAL
ncbi:hypothetical protein EN858_21795 [Mesorhizobium sp. M4B.F.Ca.ET.215.01.1.1]|uniref:hypothetical protein n=1 Tax=unclassified Mesorhizobium TaxID=325217 RepID=UPI000FCC2731|nr:MULTISPECIES: hypothetical protein [unclassified Mesorhizobium]RVD40388.1 hypothetical protein EN741_16785 [Mesorhizobium sp. M4B.F.Ca.ET.019.03.1.1]TGQ08370.1 hypothetical protein EN858_21795 [Mesorhizobium sp. M4B.F.Ca.ET.215.01.1.1]TGQ41053.1 hypothetical protein EN863_021810 [Mesorhizobium sp. M00.F.Ca.ET.220.01.1.1]TGR01927.1 hypothetical protein EN846_18655 [Mesorhizobium sp. M4B.F.Ca.ET.203.01.1.1]TGT45388.1 hypothetical protein EN812_09625 [Mesorhizobium sp. M4B.F.Ca.ET.169.01.1.1]